MLATCDGVHFSSYNTEKTSSAHRTLPGSSFVHGEGAVHVTFYQLKGTTLVSDHPPQQRKTEMVLIC